MMSSPNVITDESPRLSDYLSREKITTTGFDYHLISVFGSQSTGKSTLLNQLFGTHFGVMAEQDRRQTTRGIWLATNKSAVARSGATTAMADNILVMDVEGTDGRERGEDQDFERKSALFALATSEVLILNIWEHQVGLYHGANMALLKVVFDVNLQLFLNQRNPPRSLLFFVIRDHLGTTPLANLRNTLLQDLARIWSSLNKPPGLEDSRIEDFFDFAFAALPHKVLQPERFVSEILQLGTRFQIGVRRDQSAVRPDDEPIFLSEYSRRIPADGFSIYAEQVWEQIVSNKDLDLPTQQELMAQFRCDEIARVSLLAFDETIVPFELQQAANIRDGKPAIIGDLGAAMRVARDQTLHSFKSEASRYHKAVYGRKYTELEAGVDARLKILFHNQLAAAIRAGTNAFSEAVTLAIKMCQKAGNYDFAQIVTEQSRKAQIHFEKEAQAVVVEGASFSDFAQDTALFQKELSEVSARLRRDEMRRLTTRTERWVRSRLQESVGMEFAHLNQAPNELWDRVWSIFVETVDEASQRFVLRAQSLDASVSEIELGLWRLRRKSWGLLRAKLEEELMEGNLLLKLRENFEEKFRYDQAGVPRIWRPTDDIEGYYAKARESTLTLIPILSKFQPLHMDLPPPLENWVGTAPAETTLNDEEDLPPIGGIDDEEGKSLEEEMTMLTEARKQDIMARFRKTADAVFVEAKRSALGGMTQVPLYFYGLLLALGWNEILAGESVLGTIELMTVLRNPVYFMMLLVFGAGAYITFTLNLWGPMLQMTNAATAQAVEEAKKKLRDFLDASEPNRRPIAVESSTKPATEDVIDDI